MPDDVGRTRALTGFPSRRLQRSQTLTLHQTFTIGPTDITDLSQRYNQIKLIHQQRHWPSQTLFRDALNHIAQIFAQYRANLKFGIALLHRHHELRPGCAMVHSRGPMGEDHCSMEQLGDRRIFPCAFHCGPDEDFDFLPYEFSALPVPAPDQTFLSALAAYLRQSELREAIAIIHIDDPGKAWVEHPSPDGYGTIAVIAREQGIWDEGYTTTEWAVVQHELEVRATAIKACDDKEPAHTRP